MQVPRICCLIPAFNEARHISSVTSGAKKYVEDVIVVDDGSTDATGELGQQEGAFVIKHTHNLGKGMALRTGITYALCRAFDAVITLDADGQHIVSGINKFVSAFNSNAYDIIIGTRLWDKTSMPLL